MGDYYDDISVAPRRYMQRQWKRNKPHLPSSDSLPALRLCPNRPLFVCAQCGFANAWIPLCLWCEWTSTEATKQFEANMPRPRRLSAPSRAVPVPKKTKQCPRRMSVDSPTINGATRTPEHGRAFSRDAQGITTVMESFQGDMCHDDRRVDPHHAGAVDRVSFVSTHSFDVEKESVDGGVRRVAPATSITPPTPTCSFSNVVLKSEMESRKRNSEDRCSRPQRRKLPALCVHQPTRFRASCPSVERARPDNAMAMPAMDSVTSVLMDASSTPRSTGSMDMSDPGHGMRSTLSIASSQCSPKRGLHRTKNVALVPRDASLSPRSRSPLRGSVDIYPTSAVEQSHALFLTSSPDHDAPPVRLGHPSRPYYSAIRKDMSRPTSPVFSIAAPRTPSPILSQVDYVPRGTKSLDCGDRSGTPYARELRPMSMVLSDQTTSPVARSGFSLSGEMELRMDLARWRREDTPNEPGGYHFRETSRSPKMSMKGRVKQLGRGLKELVLGRS